MAGSEAYFSVDIYETGFTGTFNVQWRLFFPNFAEACTITTNSGETFEYKIDSKQSLQNDKNYPKMIFKNGGA